MSKKEYEEFELDNINDSDWIISSLNLSKETKIENIDSKNKHFKEYRETINNQFKEENNFSLITPRHESVLRGDFLIERNTVGDSKNYCNIQTKFKFPSFLDIKSHIKGIDSNIKYTLEIMIDIIFSSNETKALYEKYISDLKNKNIYTSKDETSITRIGTITKDMFIHVICSNELGNGYKLMNLEKKKVFIVNNKKGQKYIKVIDFTTMVNSDVINVDFYISEKGYSYLLFKDNDEVVYIISQRNKQTNNCSFIPESKITLIEESRKDYKKI